MLKKKKDMEKLTDREWEELASLLGGEKEEASDLLRRFNDEDKYKTGYYWKELRQMNSEKEIDVDKAWNRLQSRLNENGLLAVSEHPHANLTRSIFLRVAAVVIILLGIGSALLYFGPENLLTGKTVVSTTENQKNLQVTLPDGSNICLNRNTRLSYHKNFGRKERKVSLEGEAFFDIVPDASMPFTVDAGKAMVEVLGTSFNVITNNENLAVEVFVTSGKVKLSDNSGTRNLILDPGYVGTVDTKTSVKKVNDNPNYLAWNTGKLVYDGQKLDIVFHDLKRVYDMEIIADDPEILENKWTSPIDNQPQETIIRLICASFNLNFTKDGNVYHLAKK